MEEVGNMEQEPKELKENNDLSMNIDSNIDNITKFDSASPTKSSTGEAPSCSTEEEQDLQTKVMNSNKKTKKRIIIDSDSENDECENESQQNSELLEEDTQLNLQLLNQSDSENENASQEEVQTVDKIQKKKTFKLIDTDSEPEPTAESDHEEQEDAEEVSEAPIYTMNDKKELVPERNIADGLAALCDPDTSDEEEKQIAPLVYKKKSKKKGEEPEEKRMTAKEAADQRKEIDSVSQRMLRETHVSLPYHKPKQRSLKEFLQNRPRFASLVPAGASKVPVAVAIKMNKEQLNLVSKKIKEREKQVAEFYKSDSEEDEENNEDVEQETTQSNEINNEEKQESTSSNEVVPSEIIPTNIPIDANLNPNEIEELNDNFDNNSKINQTAEEMEVETVESSDMSKELNECNTNEENLDKDASTELRFNISDLSDEEETRIADVNSDRNNLTEDATNSLVKQSNKYEIDENFGKKSALQLLKEQLGTSQPKLSGAPNYVIDLEEGTTHLDEVTLLMDRFTKHASAKKPMHKKASAVELDVISVSQGGDVHKEKVAVKVEDHEEPKIEEKPWVKYQKLKNDLQIQMAQRRNELWKERQARLQAEKEANEEDDVYKGEKDECGIDDILDDEEEEFSDVGSDEDDEEADDNKQGDDEVDACQDQENEDNMLDNEAEEDDAEDEAADDELNEEEEVEEVRKSKKVVKKLRRIVQPTDSDSDDDNGEESKEKVKITEKSDKNLDSTVSWPEDDDLISAGQTNSCRTPNKQSCMQTKSELGFISPICRLTGLQSFDATANFLQDSPGSPAIKLGEPSPMKTADGWSKLLFPETRFKSTENLEEICSGIFPEQAPDNGNDVKLTETNETGGIDENEGNIVTQAEPSTQDMMKICSGNFEFTQDLTEIQPVDSEVQASHTRDTNLNIESKSKSVDILNPTNKSNCGKSEEVQIDEDEDKLISQLLDEDELETFKKKFESPLQNAYTAPIADEKIAKQIAFNAMNEVENDEDSDSVSNEIDDNEDDDKINTTKRRLKNKIVDSDEEEAMNAVDEENIDLHDEIDNSEESNDETNGENNLNDTELGYDSEENEILVEKAQQPKKMKLKDFLENEAELSESEWGSEDEDEKNLDVMELEEGDAEVFDEKKLRSDLEKIHMKRILDDDRKDLKVLQELYMDEDEELRGAGRQRQFRWRNIDNLDNEESSQPNDADDSVHHDDEEAENEEEWRKKRYERELFLQSQKQNVEEDDYASVPLLPTKSQLFKIGQRAVIRNQSINKSTQQVTIKQAYVLNTQRGSFLSRKDEVLTRVAEYTKVTDVVKGVPKNSRHFVFHSKTNDNEPTSSTSSTNFEEKKRKAADAGTPIQLKRLRLNGISPADQKKKTDSRSKARLFSNRSNNQW